MPGRHKTVNRVPVLAEPGLVEVHADGGDHDEAELIAEERLAEVTLQDALDHFRRIFATAANQVPAFAKQVGGEYLLAAVDVELTHLLLGVGREAAFVRQCETVDENAQSRCAGHEVGPSRRVQVGLFGQGDESSSWNHAFDAAAIAGKDEPGDGSALGRSVLIGRLGEYALETFEVALHFHSPFRGLSESQTRDRRG